MSKSIVKNIYVERIASLEADYEKSLQRLTNQDDECNELLTRIEELEGELAEAVKWVPKLHEQAKELEGELAEAEKRNLSLIKELEKALPK